MSRIVANSNLFLVVIIILTVIISPAAAADEAALTPEEENLRRVLKKVDDPFGDRFDLALDLDWEPELLVEVKVGYQGKKRKYISEYEQFQKEKEFNQLIYSTSGSRFKFRLKQEITPNLEMMPEVIYQKNAYQVNQNPKYQQQYIIMGISTDWIKECTWQLRVDYGFANTDGQVSFKRLKAGWEKKFLLADDKLIYNLQLGVASVATPVNYQFQGGGYDDLKLRGQEEKLVGTRYLLGSLEYYKLLVKDMVLRWITVKNIWGIGFIDGGKIESEAQFWAGNWEVDGGLGLQVEVGLGTIKTLVGFDQLQQKPTFNLELKENF